MYNEEEERQPQPAAEPTAPLTEQLGFGMGTFVAAGAVDLVAHFGLTGLVVGGIAAYVASQHGPQVLEQVRGALPTRPAPTPVRRAAPRRVVVESRGRSQRSFLDRTLGRFPDAGPQDEAEEDETVLVREPAVVDEEALFAATTRREVPGVRRLTIEQIVAHVLPNSYALYIGRSLTRAKEGYPAVRMSFFKRHLKLIGASQKGKSSMAAALLDIITRTHDTDHVLLALLDLEDQTSKLFAHLPHVAHVHVGDEYVKLHATSREQVLEHLGYVLDIMNYRYTLRKTELAEQPVLVAYIEEFLALKDYFKRRIDSVRPGERDQARADYAQLVFAISELARRGLKVRVQLLLCAQVDYRDEDLQEALINITAGMSFAVRVTAAQAAGFYDVALLKRNATDNTVGQAVVETPDCHDLVLAPDYDVEQRLLAQEQAEWEEGRALHRHTRSHAVPQMRRDFVPSADQSRWEAAQMPQDEETSQWQEVPAHYSRTVMPPLEPARPEPPVLDEQARQPLATQPAKPRPLTELERVLAVYREHPTASYRELGEKLGMGKDKVGDLLRELRERGMLEQQ